MGQGSVEAVWTAARRSRLIPVGECKRNTRSTTSNRVVFMLCMALVCGAVRGHTEALYTIDQRFGDIGFSVAHLGLFTSQGVFRKFDATFTIDSAHPERTRISVRIAANSIDMSWEEAVGMLRSAAYFDVQHYPDIRFTSTAIAPIGPDHYIIRGSLEIRGVTQPLMLDAKLVGRHLDPARHAEIADFVVTGQLKRSAFGMTADAVFISDTVNVQIHARIEMDEGSGGG